MRRHHPIASHWDQSGPTPCTQEQLQELASYVQEVSEAGVEFSNSVDAFNPGNPGNELTGFWDVLNMILYVDTPKLTAKAPKNQWLEDDIYFLLGPGLVSGVMLVSGRVAKSWLNLRLVVFPMIQKVLYTAGLVEVWTVISNNKDKHLYNVAIGMINISR